MHNPAPEHIAYCSRCGNPMITRQVGDKPRRACPECGFVHFTDPKVGAGVIVMQDDKLLLVRRRMKPEQGKWSLPAGFIDYGEDPKDVAVREALEETNLDVTIEKLIDVYYNPTPNGGASVFILYQANLLGGTPKAGDDADDVGFFALDTLPEIAFTSTRDIIRRLKQEQI